MELSVAQAIHAGYSSPTTQDGSYACKYKNIHFSAVVDGHGAGGPVYPEALIECLNMLVPEQLSRTTLMSDEAHSDLLKIIIEELHKVDVPAFAGSTVTLCMINLDTWKLYAANLGDSPLMVFLPNTEEYPMAYLSQNWRQYQTSHHMILRTNDHDANNEEEIARIRHIGGIIIKGSQGEGRLQGCTLTTAGLGDHHVDKRSEKAVVRRDPELYLMDLSGLNDFTIILGSDGMLEYPHNGTLRLKASDIMMHHISDYLSAVTTMDIDNCPEEILRMQIEKIVEVTIDKWNGDWRKIIDNRDIRMIRRRKMIES
tara:strand:+ start:257 stop:1195 length:939 start_codon:yes stop_codon:yes gene_type:complete